MTGEFIYIPPKFKEAGDVASDDYFGILLPRKKNPMKLSEHMMQCDQCQPVSIAAVREIQQLEADAELGRLVRMMPHNIGFVRYGNGFCILQRSLRNPGNTFDRETRFNGATPEEALQKFYAERDDKTE